jgi:vitamin B12 transporter
MAGVITIVTSRGTDEPTVLVDLSGGSFGEHRALVNGRGRIGNIDYALSASYLDGGEPVSGSSHIGKTVTATMGLSPTATGSLRYSLRYTDSRLEAFPDDSGGPVFAVIRTVGAREVDELTMGVAWSQDVFPTWEVSATLGYDDRREEMRSPGVAPGVRDPIPPNSSDSHYRRVSLAVNSLVEATSELQLSIGLDASIEEGDSRGSLFVGGMDLPTSFSMRRRLAATFTELRYQPVDALVLQAGVRFDVPEGHALQVNPRVSIMWTVPLVGSIIRVSWGKGFKLPSFFSLSHPIVGNPDLTVERSQSVELAVTQPVPGERGRVTAALFSTRLTDLVDFDEGPPPMLVNRSAVTLRGVELSAELKMTETVNVRPHVNFVDAQIEGTDEELRNRPRWRGGVAAGWRPTSTVVVHLELLAVGTVHDSSIPTGDQELSAYARVDLAVTWAPTDTWQLFLAADNLTNGRYEEAIGFETRGMSVRGGLRATL